MGPVLFINTARFRGAADAYVGGVGTRDKKKSMTVPVALGAWIMNSVENV